MSVAFGAVRDWRSAPLLHGVAISTSAVDLLDEAVRRLARLDVGSPATPGWQGQAGAAAAARHVELVLRVARLAADVAALDGALRLAADRVTSAEALVRHVVSGAEGRGAVVDDGGRVVAVPAGLGTDLHPSGGRADLAEIETLAARAVAEAELADDALWAALGSIPRAARTGPQAETALSALVTTGLATAMTAATATPRSAPGLGLGPRPSDAARALSWWRELGPEAQRAAVVEHPDIVGATDGVPAWARDLANRIRLVRAEVELTADADRLRPDRPEQSAISALGPLAGAATVGTLDGPSRRAAYLQVKEKLAGVRTVAAVLAAPDGRSRQLLVLDVAGRSTRAAVAVGNVDRADHVAVVVPGFTTTVARDLVGSDRLAADLAALARREAIAWGDRGDVAVVSWLGYDAPQVADTLRTRSVALRGSAQEGADLLSPFLRGLPPAVHLTLIGHSYGSTTAGLAMTRGGTGVDDLVAIGSPGLGVGSTPELGMPAARVHVLEAAQDPVADLGWFGRDPGRLAGVDRPSTDASVLPDGSAGTRSLGHSSYLTPGTTSQWNVAAVVAGLRRQQP